VVERGAPDGDPADPGRSDRTRSDPIDALTRGFLFCDLRGYTAFVEQHGDRAAAELLTAYRRIVRHAISATGGGEIRTEGDSFYIVFASASAAVRCGLAIIGGAATADAETKTPIRVGVGIHAGESVEHREGFVGSAVNIAARVCAIAAAGEVLVTDTVRSLVRTSLDVSFVPRGRRHLKGIIEPIAVYAVSGGRIVKPVASPGVGGLAAGFNRRNVLLGGAIAGSLLAVAVGVGFWLLAGKAISPDTLPGQLVFLAKADSGQVYVARPDGSERRRLTPLTGNVSQFIVRPDSGSIAFVSGQEIETASLSDVGGTTRWPGTWGLPDFYRGSALVDVHLYGWLPSGELILATGPESTLVRLAANGESVTPLDVTGCSENADAGRGTDLRVSPDGQSVAYRAGQSLWVSSIGGCGNVLVESADASQPAWSPDGDRLVFQRSSAGSSGIWVVNATGSGLRQLTSSTEADGSATWSPDGAWIVWKRGTGTTARLWVMRADGSGQQALPIGAAGEELASPFWIPDARLIPRPIATPVVPNPFGVIATYSAASLGVDRPIAIAIGPDGRVYVTDMGPSVTVFDAFGSPVAHWGRQGVQAGEFNFVHTGTDQPHASIAVDSRSRVYVSDSGNNRVQIFDASGRFLRDFGTEGLADGQFLWPFDLSVDDEGNIYVLDDGARNIQKFSASGDFIWRRDKSTLPDLTGHGHDANFDPRGRLVIGNDDNGRILYLDRDGHEVDAFNGGACDVTVDSHGNTYVAGCGSDTITVFDAAHRLVGRWQGPDMPLAVPPEFGPNGEIFALGKDGSLIKLSVHLP
jgi:class 3 adenylate cyclase